MPRYLIERVYGEAEQEAMQNIGQRMKQVAEEEFPDVELGPQPRGQRRVGHQELLRLRGAERGAAARARRHGPRAHNRAHLRDRRRRDAGGFHAALEHAPSCVRRAWRASRYG